MNRELAAASPDLVGNGDLLRGVLSGSGDCIKVLDLDGRLQFMSEGGKRVMEVEDFSKLKGCPWPGFWAGAGNAEALAAVEGAKAGKTMRFRGPAPTAKGTSRYWDVQVAPIYGANGEVAQLLSISRDISEEWAAKQRERYFIEEMIHRAKNTFSLVLAIAKQTFRGEANAEPNKAYEARILALAKAHDLATKSNLANADVLEVLTEALAPYRTGQGRFSISGPRVWLAPRQALSLTFAINELATNATKYGSLSAPGGKVDVAWSVGDQGGASKFELVWREHGGPIVKAPTRKGFGTRVIKDFLPSDFGGEVELSFEASGVVCTLTAPRENLPSG